MKSDWGWESQRWVQNGGFISLGLRATESESALWVPFHDKDIERHWCLYHIWSSAVIERHARLEELPDPVSLRKLEWSSPRKGETAASLDRECVCYSMYLICPTAVYQDSSYLLNGLGHGHVWHHLDLELFLPWDRHTPYSYSRTKTGLFLSSSNIHCPKLVPP